MSGVVRLTAGELDEEVMEELAQRMQENAWNLTSVKGNHLSGTIHAQEDQTLFFSIPYDKGWTVKIDGKSENKSTWKSIFDSESSRRKA